MKTGGWKETGPEGGKPFGQKAREWFARRLRSNLGGMDRVTASELDAVVERFVADADRYVIWEDDEQFRGGGFANGAWLIDWKKVESVLRGMLAELRAEAAAAAITTLDDWLRADLDGSLDASFAGGSSTFDPGLRARLAETARARRKNWPLRCVDCGCVFRPAPKSRGKPIRCAVCQGNRRGNDRSL